MTAGGDARPDAVAAHASCAQPCRRRSSLARGARGVPVRPRRPRWLGLDAAVAGRPSRPRCRRPPGLDAPGARRAARGRARRRRRRRRRPRRGTARRRPGSRGPGRSAAASASRSRELARRRGRSTGRGTRRRHPGVDAQAAHRRRPRSTALGPEHRFRTTVVAGAGRRAGRARRRRRPAARPPAPAAGRRYPRARRPRRPRRGDRRRRCGEPGRTGCRLGYDDSLFTGPGGQPALGADVRPRRRGQPDHARCGSTRAASAGGCGRVDRPGAAAAAGVRRAAGARAASTSSAQPVARGARGGRRRAGRRSRARRWRRSSSTSWRSATTRRAEVLLRHVGDRARGSRARSTAGPTAVARRAASGSASTCAERGSYDGSGLSRDNRLSAARRCSTCCRLAAGPEQPRLRRVRQRAAGRRLHRHAGLPLRRPATAPGSGGCGPRPAR